MELLFDASTDLSKLDAVLREAASQKFPKASKAQIDAMIAKRIRDGAERSHDAYEGCVFVTAKTSADYPPSVVRRVKGKWVDAKEGDVYAGMYGYANLTAFAYDHPQGGKGVSFALNGIGLSRDGEPLGGGFDADDAFANVEVDEDAFGGGDDVPPF